MIPSRIITRGLYPLGKGRGLLTRGLRSVPVTHDNSMPKVERSVVAALDGMSEWANAATDGTMIDLYTTAPENTLATPHMLNLIGQAQQRRTGHGAKPDDEVRVRWSKIDGLGEDEVVFTWH